MGDPQRRAVKIDARDSGRHLRQQLPRDVPGQRGTDYLCWARGMRDKAVDDVWCLQPRRIIAETRRQLSAVRQGTSIITCIMTTPQGPPLFKPVLRRQT